MENDGKLQKMEVDYASTVDEKLPECEKLAKVYIKDVNVFCGPFKSSFYIT